MGGNETAAKLSIIDWAPDIDAPSPYFEINKWESMPRIFYQAISQMLGRLTIGHDITTDEELVAFVSDQNIWKQAVRSNGAYMALSCYQQGILTYREALNLAVLLLIEENQILREELENRNSRHAPKISD